MSKTFVLATYNDNSFNYLYPVQIDDDYNDADGQ